MLEAGRQGARALATPVVDPVVAVGRDAELAEPAEDDRGRRVDVDGAEEGVVEGGEVAIAREGEGPLGRRGAPGAGDRDHATRMTRSPCWSHRDEPRGTHGTGPVLSGNGPSTQGRT